MIIHYSKFDMKEWKFVPLCGQETTRSEHLNMRAYSSSYHETPSDGDRECEACAAVRSGLAAILSLQGVYSCPPGWFETI